MLEDILKTLVTAMLPILEIRGAIPVGVAAGMDPWTAFAKADMYIDTSALPTLRHMAAPAL